MEKLSQQRILLGIGQELGDAVASRLLFGMVQREIRAQMLSKVLNRSIEDSVKILRSYFSDHMIEVQLSTLHGTLSSLSFALSSSSMLLCFFKIWTVGAVVL